LLDAAHGKAAQVVLSFGVEPRHFRGLTSEERAARLPAPVDDACDDALRHVHVKLGRREVVEEEHRKCSNCDDVVHGHGY